MTAIEGRIKPGVARLWRKYYPDHESNALARLVEAHVDAASDVLEIGAGSGMGQQRHFALKGKVNRYVGVDLDPRVLDNPHLDEAVVGSAESLPFGDSTFDVVFHAMLAEHLQRPQAAMREFARVLRPGGRLLFETPNRFYYPMLVAALTPHRFHEFYVRGFGSGRAESDVFPTVYRLNDRGAIMAASQHAGLEADIVHQSIPPGYLRFSAPSFLLGVLYERTVERTFPRLRGRLLVTASKPTG